MKVGRGLSDIVRGKDVKVGRGGCPILSMGKK